MFHAIAAEPVPVCDEQNNSLPFFSCSSSIRGRLAKGLELQICDLWVAAHPSRVLAELVAAPHHVTLAHAWPARQHYTCIYSGSSAVGQILHRALHALQP